MKIFLAKADVITFSAREYPWYCVVYAFNIAGAEAKVKEYIKESPHMDVDVILNVRVCEVAVIA